MPGPLSPNLPRQVTVRSGGRPPHVSPILLLTAAAAFRTAAGYRGWPSSVVEGLQYITVMFWVFLPEKKHLKNVFQYFFFPSSLINVSEQPRLLSVSSGTPGRRYVQPVPVSWPCRALTAPGTQKGHFRSRGSGQTLEATSKSSTKWMKSINQ